MRTWLIIIFVMIVSGLTHQPASAQPPQNHVWLRQHIDSIYQARPMADSGPYAYPAWMRLIARAYGVDFKFLLHVNNHIQDPNKPLPIDAIIFIPKRRTLLTQFIDGLDIKNLAMRNQIIAMMQVIRQHRTIAVSEFLGLNSSKRFTSSSPPSKRRLEESTDQTPWLDFFTNTVDWQLTFLSFLFLLVLIYSLVTATKILSLLINQRRLSQFEHQHGQSIAEIIEDNYGYPINELKSMKITPNLLGIEAEPVETISRGDDSDREQIRMLEDQIAQAISTGIGGQRIRFKFRSSRG